MLKGQFVSFRSKKAFLIQVYVFIFILIMLKSYILGTRTSPSIHSYTDICPVWQKGADVQMKKSIIKILN